MFDIILSSQTSMIDDAEISESVIVQTIQDSSPQRQSHAVSFYEVGKYTGRHSFGYCYEARKYRTATGEGLGQSSIVKMVKSGSDEQSSRIYDNEINVLEALREINSERFVKCLTHQKQKNNFYIILEGSRVRNLREAIGQLTLDQKDIFYFLREILKAVQLLHRNKIMHRNLKLESIVIDEQWRVKLTDFSLALQGSQIPSLGSFRTPYYTAPEAAKDSKSYSKKSEVWSIGVVFYYLIYSKFPMQQAASRSKNSSIDFPQQKHVSKETITLVQQMLTRQESKRPSIDQLLDSKIFDTTSQDHKVGQYLVRSNENWQSTKWTRKIDQKKLEEVPKEVIDQLERTQKVTPIHFLQLKKYGYFMLLSNLKLVSYFNNNHILEFQQFMLTSPKSNEQKILRFVFVKHFKPIITGKIHQIGERRFEEPQCTIKKLVSINGTVFLRLTNEVIHVLFPEAGKSNKDIVDQYTSVSLNYNRKQPKTVRVTKNNGSVEFSSKEEMKSSNENNYLSFVQNALQEILNNSIISTNPQE